MYSRPAPGDATPGAVTVLSQPTTDRSATHALVDIHVKDQWDQWRLGGVRIQPARVVISEPIAITRATWNPATPSCLLVQGVSDPLNERGSLELGEDAQKLPHHAAGGGLVLKRLGSAAESNASVVKLFDYLSEATNRTCEPIYAIDEQQVIPVFARGR